MPRGRRVALAGALGALLVGSFTAGAAAGPGDGFEAGGRPVQAIEAEDADEAAGLAETVRAGRYQVGLAGDDTPRWLTIEKTPGTSLWATFAARIPEGDDYDDELRIEVGTSDGETCGSNSIEVSPDDGYQGPVPVGVLIDPETVDSDAGTDCFNADRLLVGIGRAEAAKVTAELTILEEPQVAGASALPETVTSGEETSEPGWNQRAEATPVVGSTSFSDAPSIDDGRYSDRIASGGVRLYRVEAGFGQRVEAVLNVPAIPSGDAARLSDDLEIGVGVFGPGGRLLSGADEPVSDGDSVLFGTATPTLRYRNRESSSSAIQVASLAGPHYVMVSARNDEASVELPYELHLRVTGQVTGTPSYTGTGAPDDPKRVAPPGENDDGTDPAAADPARAVLAWPVAGPVLVGLGAALVVCAIGLVLRRRPS